MEQYKAKGVMYFTLHFESHTLPVKYIRTPKHHVLFGFAFGFDNSFHDVDHHDHACT